MNTLIQSACGPSRTLLDLTHKYHGVVCSRMGWRYILDYGGKDPFRLSLIQAALEDGADLVVGMDPDSLITNWQAFMNGPYLNGYDAGMVQVGRFHHAGTLYVNNTHEARAYLRRCAWRVKTSFTMGDFPTFFTEEQEQAKIRRLDRCWDDWPGATGPSDKPVIVQSFHGMAFNDKLREMSAALLELK